MTGLGSIAIMHSSLLVFAGSVAALTPSSAQAECREWNLNGYWEFQLENGRWAGFNLTQVRCKPSSSCQFTLDGKATYNRPRRADGYGGLAVRQAGGDLRGNTFSLGYIVDDVPEIDDESVRFEGVVHPDGSLSGRGPDDPDNPKAWINWQEKAGRKAFCMPDIVEKPAGDIDGLTKPINPPDLGVVPKPPPGFNPNK